MMKINKIQKIVLFIAGFAIIILLLMQVKSEYDYKVNGETIISIKHNNYYKTSIRYEQSVYSNGKRDIIQTRKVCSVSTFLKSLFDCQYNQVVMISIFAPESSYYSKDSRDFEIKQNKVLQNTRIGNYDGYYYDEAGSGRIGLIFVDNKMVEIDWLNPVYSWNGVNQKDVNNILNSMVIKR